MSINSPGTLCSILTEAGMQRGSRYCGSHSQFRQGNPPHSFFLSSWVWSGTLEALVLPYIWVPPHKPQPLKVIWLAQVWSTHGSHKTAATACVWSISLLEAMDSCGVNACCFWEGLEWAMSVRRQLVPAADHWVLWLGEWGVFCCGVCTETRK